jgi:hypothetical protein
MTNELKKECGVGQYWCTTDMVCKPMQKEDGDQGFVGGNPIINKVSGGEIAGLGIGKDGEPGIKKNKKGVKSFSTFIKRKPNVAS